MRKYYWYISIFFKKHGLTIVASVVAAIILFSLFLPFLLRVFESKQRSYIGVIGRYSLNALPVKIQHEVSNGLTFIEEDGSATPDLSERWSIEDEGKTYRFLLRQNVKWQDGKALEASDISYQFKDVQTISTANEIIFKLKDPFAPFPTVVAQPIFRTTTEPYLFFFRRKKLLGTGNYQVASFKETGERLQEIVLDNPRDQKIYRFYLTEEDAINGFKRGEIDELPELSHLADLRSWPTVEVKETLDQQTYLGVFFNLNDDVFKNKELRQALSYTLAKPTDETRAVGPISSTSWAFKDVGKTYEYDVNRGIERLLSTNGLPRQPIRFVLKTTPNFLGEAEQIKQQWQQFGQRAAQVCLETKEIKEKELCNNMKMEIDIVVNNVPDTSNFQALLVGQVSPSDPDQYHLWHSDQPTNFTGYQNTRIDSLLERGRQIDDQKRRLEIYQDFQQFFSEDAAVIFLRHLPKLTVKRK